MGLFVSATFVTINFTINLRHSWLVSVVPRK